MAGSPLIGFGEVPVNAVSLIDLHGVNDDTIPYDHAHAEGESSSSYWVTQKLPQICTVFLRIRIGKVA